MFSQDKFSEKGSDHFPPNFEVSIDIVPFRLFSIISVVQFLNDFSKNFIILLVIALMQSQAAFVEFYNILRWG